MLALSCLEGGFRAVRGFHTSFSGAVAYVVWRSFVRRIVRRALPVWFPHPFFAIFRLCCCLFGASARKFVEDWRTSLEVPAEQQKARATCGEDCSPLSEVLSTAPGSGSIVEIGHQTVRHRSSRFSFSTRARSSRGASSRAGFGRSPRRQEQ